MGRNTKQIMATGQRPTEVFRFACLHRSKRIVFHFLADEELVSSFDENEDILHWWKLDLNYHIDKYEFIQTAWFAGADQDQLKVIAFNRWGLNDLDCLTYVQNNTGMIAERDGRNWKVYDERIVYDPETPVGKGSLLLLAVIDYRIKSSLKENERATKLSNQCR